MKVDFPPLSPPNHKDIQKQNLAVVRKWIGVTPRIGRGENSVEGTAGDGEGYSWTWMTPALREELKELYFGEEDEDGNKSQTLSGKPCWWYTMGGEGS
jgi:hypothetical protein